MSAETSFQIDIPDEKLTILRAKLELASFPNELEDAGWKYGAPLADIKRLTERWKNGYDWRKYEKEINEQLPMFTRDIDMDGFGALNIHYVHKQSETVDAIPLLFCHGWPGSFLEVGKVLPLLTSSAPEHPSFHVVALSLPGFGFSEAPHKQGFAIDQYAELTNSWSLSGTTSMLPMEVTGVALLPGEWLLCMMGGITRHGIPTVHCIAKPPSWRSPLFFLSFLLTPWSTEEKAGIERTTWFRTKGQGYLSEQSTQPQTLGYSLTDSPVGLLACIYEKLILWTDNYNWSDDEVLTWISLYWFSRDGPAASLRIYFELRDYCEDIGQNPTIPMGASFFPKELIVLPAAWLRKSHNVVFESHHKTGGHFAATEHPEELVQDMRKMFAKGGPAFAIVPGRIGYA